MKGLPTLTSTTLIIDCFGYRYNAYSHFVTKDKTNNEIHFRWINIYWRCL